MNVMKTKLRVIGSWLFLILIVCFCSCSAGYEVIHVPGGYCTQKKENIIFTPTDHYDYYFEFALALECLIDQWQASDYERFDEWLKNFIESYEE